MLTQVPCLSTQHAEVSKARTFKFFFESVIGQKSVITNYRRLVWLRKFFPFHQRAKQLEMSFGLFCYDSVHLQLYEIYSM